MSDATQDASAASSAASPETPAVVLTDLSAMTADERSAWRRTGDLPTRPKTADPAPADPATQDASTEATDKPSESDTGAKRPRNAKTRKEELDADITDLTRQREALKETLRQRAILREEVAALAREHSSRAEPTESRPSRQDDPEPAEDSYQDYREYVRDWTKWNARHEARREAQAILQREREEGAKQARHAAVSARADAIERSAVERLKAAERDRPDLVASLSPTVLDLVPTWRLRDGEQPSALNLVADAILESERGLEMGAYFSDHQDELAAMSRMRPKDLLRALARVEARLELSSASHAAAAKATPDISRISRAAKPPETPVGRGSAPAQDPIQAALERGDFREYKRLANERELASRR